MPLPLPPPNKRGSDSGRVISVPWPPFWAVARTAAFVCVGAGQVPPVLG